ESGGGYTWAENSREFKLTSWANDPLLDAPAEWLYLRDEGSGDILRPLPQAVAAGQKYHIQHGQGFTRFQVEYPGLTLETTISVAGEDPVKFIRVMLSNTSQQTRRFSLTYFVEWVLGVNREQTQLHVATARDDSSGALTARNPYHPELAGHVAFLWISGSEQSWTGDRTEFIGCNGDPVNPQSLSQ